MEYHSYSELVERGHCIYNDKSFTTCYIILLNVSILITFSLIWRRINITEKHIESDPLNKSIINRSSASVLVDTERNTSPISLFNTSNFFYSSLYPLSNTYPLLSPFLPSKPSFHLNRIDSSKSIPLSISQYDPSPSSTSNSPIVLINVKMAKQFTVE